MGVALEMKGSLPETIDCIIDYAIDFAREWYQPNYSPPWSREEMRAKVQETLIKVCGPAMLAHDRIRVVQGVATTARTLLNAFRRDIEDPHVDEAGCEKARPLLDPYSEEA